MSAWSLTRRQVVFQVLTRLGVTAAEETPAAADAQLVERLMDQRLAELHRQGILWWKVQREGVSLPVAAAAAQVELPEDCLYPLALVWHQGGSAVPVELVAPGEFARLPDETASSGSPRLALATAGALRLWPVPAQAGHLRLVYQAMMQPGAPHQPPDLPDWGVRALVRMVAADAADSFGLTEARITRLNQEARLAEREIMRLLAPPEQGQSSQPPRSY
ncbi:MAG: hypothetical protein H7831_13125 [Magnetococcus sp. WYHC-3]